LKRFLRYTFFSKYTLLLVAMVLFFLSYIFNTYYTNLTSVSRERKLLEKYVHKQQEDYFIFLHDTLLLRKLIHKEESLDEFKEISSKPYGIFLFAENVSGDFNMLFWSDQLILPPTGSYTMPDGETFEKLANGYYIVQKNTVKLPGMTNNVISFAMIPVEFEYFLAKVEDLPKEFTYSKTAEQKILITDTVTANPVHSLAGNILFYLNKKDYVAIPYNDLITIALRLGGLFLLLLFIHLVAESLARRTKAWKAISFLGLCLILLRFIMYEMPFLLNQRQFTLFDPSIYGSDIIQRSLGDLLVNAIVFCWIVVFAWSKTSHKEYFGILGSKRWKWVVGGASLVLLILSTFLLANTIRSMVADTLLTNRAMIGLARRLGYAIRLSREDPELRACAAVALGRIKSNSAQEALRKAANEKDVVVRNAVSRALRGAAT